MEYSDTAIKLLKSPYLLQQIVSDMKILTGSSNEPVLLLAYLAATSRKMNCPYSLVMVLNEDTSQDVLSSVIQKLVPDEDIVNIPLSFSALENLGEDKFIHKLWLLGEVSPYDKMVIQLVRQMVGENELGWIKSEIKDKDRIKQIKRTSRVSIFLSTRFKRVTMEACRGWFIVNRKETTASTWPLSDKDTTASFVKKHKQAQRLLKEVFVMNPFKDKLEGVNRKFLDVIECVAFLRQYQKELKFKDSIPYIECDLKDYKISYEIGKEIFKEEFLKESEQSEQK